VPVSVSSIYPFFICCWPLRLVLTFTAVHWKLLSHEKFQLYHDVHEMKVWALCHYISVRYISSFNASEASDMSTIFQQMCVEHGLLCAAALGVCLFYCERNHFLMGWEDLHLYVNVTICVNDICQWHVQLCNEVGIHYDPFRRRYLFTYWHNTTFQKAGIVIHFRCTDWTVQSDRSVNGWKTQSVQYWFMPYVERKCRNVLSVLLCNVCSNKFDAA